MNFSQIIEYINNKVFHLGEHQLALADLLLVPLWIIIAFWVSKLLIKAVANRMNAKGSDPNVVHLIERVMFVVALTIIFMSTLSLLNVPLSAFAFISGAIAIGVGFGAQNIINNFISGWILMWEKPIRIGDFLEVEDSKGIVEEINTRSTRIRRVDGVHMLIPNSKLLENTVTNWTLVDNQVRTSIRIGVAYGSPVKKVAQLIEQATKEQEEVLDNPEVNVLFEDFGDNALIFEAIFWVNSSAEGGLRRVRSKIRFRLEELFNQDEIIVAYPQRDLHLDGEITIKQKS